MTMKHSGLAAAVVAAGLIFTGSANAAPLGSTKTVSGAEQSQAQTVDYRGHRHCHRKHGRKWCHGESSYRRSDGPGVSIYIGPRHGHRHHHRRWGNNDHHHGKHFRR